MLKLKSKWIWLVAGVLCGTVFSASSEERKIQSVDLKVAAVSLEDAQERAQEILAEERPVELGDTKVIAAFTPTCENGEGNHSFYRCSVKVISQ